MINILGTCYFVLLDATFDVTFDATFDVTLDATLLIDQRKM